MSDARLLSEDQTVRSLFDTAFRGMLAVALYMAFPAFSDIFRLWERNAGFYPDWPAGPLEYPPVAFFYFEPLSLLPTGRWAVAVNGLVMVLAAVGITWALMRFARTLDSRGADLRLWINSPALVLFLPINWDVLVVLISVLAIAALYRSQDALSGVWHGVGTAFKIFPGAIVLPVLPLIEGWRRRVVFLASGFSVLAASYLLYAVLDPVGWRFHLEFASLRTDVESTIWGVARSLADVFGSTLPLGAINTMSTVISIAGLLAVTVWAARARPTLAEVATMAIIVLLLFNKVFKPQYVLWLVPFLAWIRAGTFKTRLLEATALVQFAAIYFAFPSFVFPIEAGVRIAILVLLADEVFRRVSERPITPMA